MATRSGFTRCRGRHRRSTLRRSATTASRSRPGSVRVAQPGQRRPRRVIRQARQGRPVRLLPCQLGRRRPRRKPDRLNPQHVGDLQDQPPHGKFVVDEPPAVHRLHHPAHRLAIHRHPTGQPYSPSRSAGARECSTSSPSLEIKHTSTRLRLRSNPTCNICDPTPFHKDEQDQPGPSRKVRRGRSFVFR